MDIFSMGSVRSQIASINMRKEWEHKQETGDFFNSSETKSRFDKNDIKAFKPTVIEQPKDEKTNIDNDQIAKLKNEIESLYENIRRQIEDAKKLSGENGANQPEGQHADDNKAEKQTEKESGEKSSIPEWILEQMDAVNSAENNGEYDKSRDYQLSAINGKLLSGTALTNTEMQYLMKRDPAAYQNARRIDGDRKFYGKMLSCCRTKDDVNSLRLSNSLSALEELKKIKSGSGDMETLSYIMQRNAALEKEFNGFVKRGCYSALPTKAECRKVYSDLRKARKYEQNKKRAEAAAKKKKNTEARKKALKYKKNPGDGKLTTYQVLSSSAAKKVLRSRRKRGIGCSALSALSIAGKKSE